MRAMTSRPDPYRLLFGAWLPLVMMALATSVSANGVFYPDLTVELPPKVPTQTACIVHEDGMETLIVESTMQTTDTAEFAWILPIPAEPTSIEQADPGLMPTLRFFYAPKVITPSEVGIGFAVWVFGSSMLIVLSFLVREPRLRDLLIVLMIIFVLSAFAVPNWLEAGTEPLPVDPASLDLLDRQQVGNYDVRTLEVTDAKQFNNWMESEGFRALSDEGLEIVQEYADERWVFLVSSIRKDTDFEALAPHPLKVTFPFEKPVYPMKPTSVSGDNTLVDLYVFADGPYSHPAFELYQLGRAIPVESESQRRLATHTPARRYSTIEYGDLPQMFEPDDKSRVLSRLRADFTPGQMRAQDVVLERGPLDAEPKVFFNPKAIVCLQAKWFLFSLSAFLPFIGMAIRRRKKDSKKPHWKGIAILLVIALGLSGLLGVSRGMGLETIGNTNTVPGGKSVRSPRLLPQMILREAQHEDPAILESRDRLLDYVTQNYENRLMGLSIREEVSPGNITIEKMDNGELVVHYYGERGRVHSYSTAELSD